MERLEIQLETITKEKIVGKVILWTSKHKQSIFDIEPHHVCMVTKEKNVLLFAPIEGHKTFKRLSKEHREAVNTIMEAYFAGINHKPIIYKWFS